MESIAHQTEKVRLTLYFVQPKVIALTSHSYYSFSMSKNYYDIVIIGGGASGLMLAANLELNGASGVILEGTSNVGTKLLMSGGGHCNITHGGSIKDFLNAYGDAGQSFRKCLYRHSNLDLVRWFDSHGLKLADESGVSIEVSGMSGSASALEGLGRIFPASMKARDVLDLLLTESKSNGWEIRTNAKVCKLSKFADAYNGSPDANRDPVDVANDERLDGNLDDGDVSCDSVYQWSVVTVSGEVLTARNVVIATGGVTYPQTGSDGSMLTLMKNLGVEVTDPRPALAPVFVKDYPYSELSGISIADVEVTAFGSDAAHTCKGKAARMTGDLLFTHDGFSGPVILSISRYAEPGRIIRIQYRKEKQDLPKRMQRILEDRARGSSGDIRTSVLAALLDHDDFVVSEIDKRGMVTAGGIALSNIETATMSIKQKHPHGADDDLLEGLYAIGEAIDADGITGGYNLQLCWSTACTAAESLQKYFS